MTANDGTAVSPAQSRISIRPKTVRKTTIASVIVMLQRKFERKVRRIQA